MGTFRPASLDPIMLFLGSFRFSSGSVHVCHGSRRVGQVHQVYSWIRSIHSLVHSGRWIRSGRSWLRFASVVGPFMGPFGSADCQFMGPRDGHGSVRVGHMSLRVGRRSCVRLCPSGIFSGRSCVRLCRSWFHLGWSWVRSGWTRVCFGPFGSVMCVVAMTPWSV